MICVPPGYKIHIPGPGDGINPAQRGRLGRPWRGRHRAGHRTRRAEYRYL